MQIFRFGQINRPTFISLLLAHSAGGQTRPPRNGAVAVECKKTGRQRQGSRRQNGNKGLKSAMVSVPSPVPSLATGIQDVDLEAVESVEIRGNQVILTLDDSSADSTDDIEAQLDEEMHVMDAVVKIFCTHTEPNYSLPWQRKRQFASTSSGFMVAGEDGQRWLLTNAHSVEYHSQVKVKRRGDDRKFLANVLAIGTECDIALLSVAEEEFWEGVEPISLGPLPALQDSVYVVGYPIGGDTISVTSGVVSRIEVTSYAHGATELLGVQIDAAINSGNSGGPVFSYTGHCIGIAFQSYAGSEVENIGWVIPTPVILHFLDDFRRNGTFTGFPALGIQWQRMESSALRAASGMDDRDKGVLVRAIQPISHAVDVVQPGDIILKFDGVQVACDGTVPFRSGERIAFSYLTSQKFTGDMCVLDILRKGERKSVTVRLMRPNALVPHHLCGSDPSYLVVGGVVFTVVTEPYLLSEYGPEYPREAPVKILDRLLHGNRRWPDEEVVVVSQVLACEATIGYEDGFNVQVLSFNGEPVRNLRHLASLVLECRERFMSFELEYKELLVLETEVAHRATAEMVQAHSIPSMVSKELRDLLGNNEAESEEVMALEEEMVAAEQIED